MVFSFLYDDVEFYSLHKLRVSTMGESLKRLFAFNVFNAQLN